MYGTVARLEVKPGKFKELQKWAENHPMPDSPGAVAGYAFRADDDANEGYLVVVFESEDAYKANAERPETDREFREMMQWLESEPEWHDGTVVWAEQVSC